MQADNAAWTLRDQVNVAAIGAIFRSRGLDVQKVSATEVVVLRRHRARRFAL